MRLGFTLLVSLILKAVGLGQYIIRTMLHPIKIGVCVVTSRGELLARFTLMQLLTLYQKLLEPCINQLDDVELTNIISPQDATAHTTRTTINYLEEFFSGRLISVGLWSSRSLDLTPLDFFWFHI
jgi:hypothetical protein